MNEIERNEISKEVSETLGGGSRAWAEKIYAETDRQELANPEMREDSQEAMDALRKKT